MDNSTRTFTTDMKNNIIKKICENQNIVKYINSNYLESPEELMYVNIYPYIKLKEEIEENEEIYIGIALSSPDILENDIYKKLNLTVFILSHKNKLKTLYGGTSVDLIGDEILYTFNHNTEFGFKYSLLTNDEGAYNEKYYFRQLVFSCVANNNMEHGNRINRYDR